MSSAFLGNYPFNSLRKVNEKLDTIWRMVQLGADSICWGWHLCMVKCAAHWVWEHWYIVTLILAWPGWKLIMGFLKWRKERRLLKLSRILRKQADASRAREPNVKMFNPAGMSRHLGKDSKRIDEVLDFMHEKGWAGKTGFKDSWWIL
jgi:hypothetical protein